MTWGSCGELREKAGGRAVGVEKSARVVGGREGGNSSELLAFPQESCISKGVWLPFSVLVLNLSQTLMKAMDFLSRKLGECVLGHPRDHGHSHTHGPRGHQPGVKNS